MDCVADLKGKEVKRAALNELVECVGSTRGVLIEPVYPDIIRMVSTLVRMPREAATFSTLLSALVEVMVYRLPMPAG